MVLLVMKVIDDVDDVVERSMQQPNGWLMLAQSDNNNKYGEC